MAILDQRYLYVHDTAVDAMTGEFVRTNFFLGNGIREQFPEVQLDVTDLELDAKGCYIIPEGAQAGVEREKPNHYKIFNTRESLRNSGMKPVIGGVALREHL